MNPRRFPVGVASVVLSMSALAYADAGSARSASEPNISQLKFDLTVPESPALAVLGVTAETVIHPTSPRVLATSLLNGVGADGNFQSGFALDTAPYLLFFGRDVTFRDYSDSYWERFASRSQLSFATARGAGNDDALQYAVGLRLTLWDPCDPRLDRDLIKCLTDAVEFPDTTREMKQVQIWREKPGIRLSLIDDIEKIRTEIRDLEAKKEPNSVDIKSLEADRDKLRGYETNLAMMDALLKKYADVGDISQLIQMEVQRKEAEIERERKRCIDERVKRKWNTSSLAIGIAPTWVSPDGSTENIGWSGAALYGSLAYGFEHLKGLKNRAQLVLHTRYRAGESAPSLGAEDVFIEQDTLIAGGQLRVAGPRVGGREGGRDFSFTFDAAYVDFDRAGDEDDSSFRYAISTDIRIVEDTYLRVSFGGYSGREDDADGSFVIGNLKFGF